MILITKNIADNLITMIRGLIKAFFALFLLLFSTFHLFHFYTAISLLGIPIYSFVKFIFLLNYSSHLQCLF